MDRYRYLWWGCTMLSVTLGASMALVTLPLAQTLSVFACVTMVTLMLAMMIRAAIHTAPQGDIRSVTGPLRVAVWSGLCGLGITGLWMLLGPLSITLAVVLAALSPVPVGWALRRREGPVAGRAQSRPGVDPGQATTAGDAQDLDDLLPSRPWMCEPPQSMPDDALCLAWRLTYAALEQQLSLDSRGHVVQRRQELLDEMERRNARGLSAWLCSGARAAGNPSRVFRSPDHPQHDLD